MFFVSTRVGSSLKRLNTPPVKFKENNRHLWISRRNNWPNLRRADRGRLAAFGNVLSDNMSGHGRRAARMTTRTGSMRSVWRFSAWRAAPHHTQHHADDEGAPSWNRLLIDLAHADARHFATRSDQGFSLISEITQMNAPAPDLTFRETMSGPLALHETDPLAGAGKGRRTPFTFHATISMDDLDAFIRNPRHAARLVAHVSYPPFGDDLPVKRGSFNLFKSGDEPNIRLMTYGMAFEHQGRGYYLSGTKTIHDDKGLDLWHDTTLLYCRLHQGPDEGGPVVGAGVLKLGLRDLLKLVSSIRSSREGSSGIQAVASFGRFFLGTLWRVYGPGPSPLRGTGQEPHHEPTT